MWRKPGDYKDIWKNKKKKLPCGFRTIITVATSS